MRTYREGKLSLTSGSKNVVGVGTTFLANVSIGDIVACENGQSFEVVAVTTDTAMTVDVNAKTTGQVDYAIMRFVTGVNFRDLSVKIEQFLADRQKNLNEFTDWQTGTATGGPNNNGKYPLTDRYGVTRMYPCPALMSAEVAQSATEAAASAAEVKAIQLLLPTPQQFVDITTQVDAITADPVNAVTSWEIPAKALDAVQGGASYIAASSRLGAWNMPNAVASYLATLLSLPSHWTKIDVYVKWVNNVANAGNVVLGGEIHKFAMGESINVAPTGGSAIQAAVATPWVAKESKVAAGLVIDPSRLTILRIARQGASANDNLPNAISIISIRLVKKP